MRLIHTSKGKETIKKKQIESILFNVHCSFPPNRILFLFCIIGANSIIYIACIAIKLSFISIYDDFFRRQKLKLKLIFVTFFSLNNFFLKILINFTLKNRNLKVSGIKELLKFIAVNVIL